jgi:predicted transcriptional regulator
MAPMKRKSLVKAIDLVEKFKKCVQMGGMCRYGIVDKNKVLK